MKNIKFTILPAVGHGGTHRHGTVKDLLFRIPYLFMEKRKNIVPTMSVINNLLRKGIKDVGMSGGCRWKPFEISEDEYNELVEELLTEPNYEFDLIEPPKHIKTFEKWFMWRIKFIKQDEN